MKRIVFLLIATVSCHASISCSESVKISSSMMSATGNDAKDAFVLVEFTDGSSYQTQAPLITSENQALRNSKYAVIDIDKAPENIKQNFIDALSPASNYVIISKEGDRRGDVSGSGEISSTAVPGHLLWRNFIGSFKPGKKMNRPGAERRIDICLGGSCEEAPK